MWLSMIPSKDLYSIKEAACREYNCGCSQRVAGVAVVRCKILSPAVRRLFDRSILLPKFALSRDIAFLQRKWNTRIRKIRAANIRSKDLYWMKKAECKQHGCRCSPLSSAYAGIPVLQTFDANYSLSLY